MLQVLTNPEHAKAFDQLTQLPSYALNNLIAHCGRRDAPYHLYAIVPDEDATNPVDADIDGNHISITGKVVITKAKYNSIYTGDKTHAILMRNTVSREIVAFTGTYEDLCVARDFTGLHVPYNYDKSLDKDILSRHLAPANNPQYLKLFLDIKSWDLPPLPVIVTQDTDDVSMLEFPLFRSLAFWDTRSGTQYIVSFAPEDIIHAGLIEPHMESLGLKQAFGLLTTTADHPSCGIAHSHMTIVRP